MSIERRDGKPSEGDQLTSDNQRFVRTQYRTQDNLSVRIRTHEKYSEENVDFTSWILDAISWRGDEVVLDVGCGAGIYMDAVRQRTPTYIGGDLSLGMLRGFATRNATLVNLDAQYIPLAAHSVDVILANHMLYHVPDITQALREFQRTLRPGGRLIAATNSNRNMAELEQLQRETLWRLGLPASQGTRPNLTFTLEDGVSILSKWFGNVQRRDLPGALVFPEPQPVVDYLASSHDRFEAYLPHGLGWQDVAQTLRAILQEKIAAQGAFRVHKLSGAFVCWNE